MDVQPSERRPSDAARIRIQVSDQTGAIRLQLTWDTRTDPNPMDTMGTYMDLHFMHPNDSDWAATRMNLWTCNCLNPGADWGRMTVRDDDPPVDIDDDNGLGPAEISLNQPENTDMLGGSYRVGIHYYRASIAVNLIDPIEYPSTATITIFLDGEVAYRSVQAMERTNDFWGPASISWTPDDKSVIEVNERFRLEP